MVENNLNAGNACSMARADVSEPVQVVNTPENIASIDTRTPLELAVENRQYSMIQAELLRPGVNPDRIQINGLTVLHRAIASGDIVAVGILLYLRVNPHAPDANGLRPIDRAIRMRQIESLAALRRHGVTIRSLGSDGLTPLHRAAAVGDIEAVDFLVASGVNVNTAVAGGWRAIDYAFVYNHLDVVSRLRAAGSFFYMSPSQTLFLAASEGNLELVQDRIHGGAPVDFEDSHHRTPLHLASIRGHLAIVWFLVGAGASLNAVADENLNALQLAERHGHHAVANFLRAAMHTQASAAARSRAGISSVSNSLNR